MLFRTGIPYASADNPERHEKCIECNFLLALMRTRMETIIEFLCCSWSIIVNQNYLIGFKRKPTISTNGLASNNMSCKV